MSDPFLGEISYVGFNFAPQGYAQCSGQTLPISQYTALYSLLGVNFGGNGTSTFQVPNLATRQVCGQGQGPGLSGYTIGQTFGTAGVTLTLPQLPQHTHIPAAVYGRAAPRTATPTATSGLGTYLGATPYAAPASSAVLAPEAVTVAGNGQPHSNQQPALGLLPIIALQGVYPQRQ